jgi:hypothetical protein
MTPLDDLMPAPRLREVEEVDVAASPAQVWQAVRHGDLSRSWLTRALFAVRTLPERLADRRRGPRAIRVDDLVSTPERPGFQLLIDEPPAAFAVGAIGKVWRLRIPYVHVAGADRYRAFDDPGFVKVAWAVRLVSLGEARTHVALELRVSATSDDAWRRFRRYYRVVGPGSRLVRRTLLSRLVRDLGAVPTPRPRGPAPAH